MISYKYIYNFENKESGFSVQVQLFIIAFKFIDDPPLFVLPPSSFITDVFKLALYYFS